MEHSYGFFEEDKLGNLGDMALWRRILTYVSPQKKGVVTAIFLSIAVIAASLTLPYLIRIAIDNYIMDAALDRSTRLAGLYRLAVLFSVVVAAGFLSNFFQVTVLERTGQKIMHRLRQNLFSHLLSLDLSFFNNNPAGKLVTRLTNDIQNMHEMFTSVIITLFNDCIQLTGILIILFVMNWKLALIMTLLLPVIIALSFIFSKMARDAFRAIRSQLAIINSFLQESLSGIFLIQHFLRESDTDQKFVQQNTLYTEKTLHQIKLFGIFLPLIEVISSLAIALIIWYGGSQVLEKHMTFGVLAAFLSYMRLFFRPVREVSQKFSIIQSAMASAERIFELLDQRSALPAPVTTITPALTGAVAFQEVTFSYDAHKLIMQNLSFSIEPGETMAIVGPTGSGKTTIINLLERLYDPDSGVVLLDNTDIRLLDAHWLRSQLGLVIQDVFLIPGTLRDNICFGQEVSADAMRKVLIKAQLTKVVAELPDQLETVIGEGGYELSTGQKQLLSLARVLVRNPRILILDEATASIDSMTETLLDQAIAATVSSRTSIIIAHRLSTIRRADRIIVLDKGVIVEQGRFQELMAREGIFKRMIEEQQLR